MRITDVEPIGLRRDRIDIGRVDGTLWDIAARAAGRPFELLGGARVREVPVYASEVMPESPDEVRRIIERAIAEGTPPSTSLAPSNGRPGPSSRSPTRRS
jgi:L-alanine-DL-glutamate epimerase-like enolase superfamily enzyme